MKPYWKVCNPESWSTKNYWWVLGLFLPIFKASPMLKHKRLKFAAFKHNSAASKLKVCQPTGTSKKLWDFLDKTKNIVWIHSEQHFFLDKPCAASYFSAKVLWWGTGIGVLFALGGRSMSLIFLRNQDDFLFTVHYRQYSFPQSRCCSGPHWNSTSLKKVTK